VANRAGGEILYRVSDSIYSAKNSWRPTHRSHAHCEGHGCVASPL